MHLLRRGAAGVADVDVAKTQVDVLPVEVGIVRRERSGLRAYESRAGVQRRRERVGLAREFDQRQRLLRACGGHVIKTPLLLERAVTPTAVEDDDVPELPTLRSVRRAEREASRSHAQRFRLDFAQCLQHLLRRQTAGRGRRRAFVDHRHELLGPRIAFTRKAPHPARKRPDAHDALAPADAPRPQQADKPLAFPRLVQRRLARA